MNSIYAAKTSRLAAYLILILLPGAPLLPAYGQQGTITGDGEVVYTNEGSAFIVGTKVFTSYVSHGNDVDNMLQLDAISLMRLGTDLSGGIAGIIYSGGKITLSVFAYNQNTPSGKGNLLYEKYLDQSSGTFKGKVNQIKSPFSNDKINSDNIKVLLQTASVAYRTKAPCQDVVANLFQSSLAYADKQVPVVLQNSLYECLKGNNYSPTQPVIVQVTVKNASVNSHGLKIPGLVDDFDLAKYFDPKRVLQVGVMVNGVLRGNYVAGDSLPQILDLKLGDSVTFEVMNSGGKKPVVEGVPAVWIARFAGDLMYYCTPSVHPGEFNPWIGYDSRVHSLQMRKYPDDFNVNVRDWSYNSKANVFTWSWIAQRRMDAAKPTYSGHYNWEKYKVLANGTKQRHNQREGLNIQFLQYWNNWQASDFKKYDGEGRYMMGFDDDEFLYLNSKYRDTKISEHVPGDGGGIIKLDSLPWRGMPEGSDQIYDVATGYPIQGVPLNIIITAYRKNREAQRGRRYDEVYDGYEIQDLGTDNEHPHGTGTGNNAAPGIIKIRAGGKVCVIKMNVTAPLATDKGQYGSIEGEQWPGYGERDLPYSLVGLENLSSKELDKFSLEYEGADDFGALHRQTHYLKDLSSEEKIAIQNSGKWTSTFDNKSPQYAAVTAYYQNSGSRRVVIAGKELKSIFLLFFGESNLEGFGLGAKIWLGDYRTKKYDDFLIQRNFITHFLYTKKYIRNYTFPIGTTTVFTSRDGDPHLFKDVDTEWFLSSRTQASRITDSFLDGTEPGTDEAYLNYYIDGVLQKDGRSGKKFTHTWTEPGTYELNVRYRNAEDYGLTSYYNKITIVDYKNGVNGASTLGAINIYEPSIREKAWLNLSGSDWRVLEVTDIYSSYMYNDGPRANKEYNRWAEHKDYAAEYVWKLSDDEHTAPQIISNPSQVDAYLSTYDYTNWFWPVWALHYSSNWVTKYPNGLPDYVDNDKVTRVVTLEVDKFASYIKDNLFNPTPVTDWQYVVPLVSYTDFQGFRMRHNPSCVYDLNAVWSNTTGAFSGNPTLPSDPSAIHAPDISDDDKDRMELYYDLFSKRKIIVNTNTLSQGDILVYNVTDKNLSGLKFIASLSPEIKRNSTARESSSIDALNAAVVNEDISKTVAYPNPNNGHFLLMLSDSVEGLVMIEMTDLNGKIMFAESQTVSNSYSAIEVNATAFPKGTYILKVRSSKGLNTQKIVIE